MSAHCITATLTRGRVYVYKNVQYERGVPVVVDEGLADELEDLVEVVKDADGDEFDKPYFKVNRDAVPPVAPVAPVRSRRVPRSRDTEEAEAEPVRPARVPRRPRA